MSDQYVWFEGVPFPSKYLKCEIIKEVRDKFVLQDEDIFTVAYPKSGINWVIEIVCLINSKGDPKWSQSVPIWYRSPWIETKDGNELINGKERPMFISSHLPFHLFPKSFFSSKAKVIYVIRNPRDVLVSGFYFWNAYLHTQKAESLEQYLHWFLQGLVPWGSWFEHVRGWMSLRGRENFLVLSYEELQKDIRGSIQKICQFLGKSLDLKSLDLVVKYSSFQSMKENKMSNYSLLHHTYLDPNTLITRKGVSGDWKNHFTVAQAEVFDKVYQEKMLGCPPGLFPWE
ncbi:PREDICTED: 3-beta-hydroxysteroid sulfotransferase-like [Chinchilla lanigera]|uniref:Sulfotransferase n=1 Tax=Chinchilla lanigera TaxID=34839 RepID=A0A8C2UJ45_CHILA|nr:PREDICTED: 3-beta-hydroxysteroid sulfotransferase-like [Chinchilla lanigera]